MKTDHWLTAGAMCAVLTPLVTAAADLVRMRAELSGTVAGIVSDDGAAQTRAMFDSIAAHAGLYQAASWLALAAALLAIPAIAAIRRLTVDRSPRWSTAGLVTGWCLVIGQFVHLMGYYTWNQVLAAAPDQAGAATLTDQLNGNVFGLVVFAPYLVGVLLYWPFAAVGLWRSRRIPIWALVLVLAAGVLMAAAGSSYVTSTIWGIATAVGMVPVVIAQASSARTASRMRAMAATEASTSASVVR